MVLMIRFDFDLQTCLENTREKQTKKEDLNEKNFVLKLRIIKIIKMISVFCVLDALMN